MKNEFYEPYAQAYALYELYELCFEWELRGLERPPAMRKTLKAGRDFTYVDDIARGTILAEKALGYEIINLGGGKEPVTINQFIAWIEELTGKKATINYQPIHKADMDCTMANIEKAKRILGWEPEVNTLEGLTRITENKDSLIYSV